MEGSEGNGGEIKAGGEGDGRLMSGEKGEEGVGAKGEERDRKKKGTGEIKQKWKGESRKKRKLKKGK